MRRSMMFLTVVALMMVMVAMSVAPAFARWETSGDSQGCRTGSLLVSYTYSPEDNKNADMFVCQIRRESGNFVRFVYYDNRPLPG